MTTRPRTTTSTTRRRTISTRTTTRSSHNQEAGKMTFLSELGWLFLLRWFHFLAGITWIGMLYYFNFVQTPFFASAEPPVRSGMIVGGLVGRALWRFRLGAMFTIITISLYILHIAGKTGQIGR